MVHLYIDTETMKVTRGVGLGDEVVGELKTTRNDSSYMLDLDESKLGLIPEPTGDSPLNAQRASSLRQ